MFDDLPPGPALVEAVAAIDPAVLDDAGRIGLLVAWERVSGWVAARVSGALIAVAGAEPAPIIGLTDIRAIDAAEREEVAAALRVSPISAQHRIDTARLVARVPAALDAVAAGRLGWRSAVILAQECERLPGEVAAKLAADVVAGYAGAPQPRFTRAARRAVASADPIGAAVAVAAAGAPTMTYDDHGDGLSSLHAIGPTPDILAIWRGLGRHARAAGPLDGADPGATRLAALRELAITDPVGAAGSGRPDGRPARARSRRPLVQVVTDLPTLLGLADRPAHLPGSGPLPAHLARALAVDADWQRLVVDPVTGQMLSASPRRYRPGPALRAYLSARDRTCAFPGCPVSAEHCDADHTIAFDRGGGTVPENLGLLCRRHHRLKTLTGWSLVRHEDQSVTWTSPTGHRYHVPLAGPADP